MGVVPGISTRGTVHKGQHGYHNTLPQLCSEKAFPLQYLTQASQESRYRLALQCTHDKYHEYLHSKIVKIQGHEGPVLLPLSHPPTFFYPMLTKAHTRLTRIRICVYSYQQRFGLMLC